MIYASCRARMPLGTIVFANKLYWSGDSLTTLNGKRVLVIVHGSANSRAQLDRLAAEIANRTGASFDAFVMFCWPGGVSGVAYLLTRFTAVRRASKFLMKTLGAIAAVGPLTIDIDAHSLGVPIAFEAALRSDVVVDGIWAKAGACGRSLAKYRPLLDYDTAVHVFYSPKDFVVGVLYRIWFGAIGGALGAYGEKSKGGNIGVQHDVSPEIGGGHADYRACSIIVQAMRDEAERRKKL